MVVKTTYYGREVELDFPDDKLPPMPMLKEIDDLFPETHEHGFMETWTTGGSKLHYRVCLPPKDVPLKGILTWQHGIGAQSGIGVLAPSSNTPTNFPLLSSLLNKEGYGIYLLDMKGHGLSEGVRFYIPDSWTVNRDDFCSFVSHVCKQHPEDTPLFIGGDSYGGNLAIHVARMIQDKQLATTPKNFCGLCLVAPAIVGDLPPAPVVFVLRNILKPLYPEWIPFFMPHPINPEAVWSDPEIRGLQTDPRKFELGLQNCATPFRLGTAANLLSALEHAREQSIPGLKVPFFVAHGAQDKGVPIVGTEDYLIAQSNVSDEDKKYLREEDAKHDLLSEPCREHVAKEMITWMNSRLGKPFRP